jgi:hypothetical protein
MFPIVAVTVKVTPLLATPPTVTTTLPGVAPLGTVAKMLVEVQVVTAAAVPLKVTALAPWLAPKFAPEIVTDVPTGPDVGFRLVMLGGGVTVKDTPLLTTPPTDTTTLPVVAPTGTGMVMLVSDQLVDLPCVPLNVTKLDIGPTVGPKFAPVIVTIDPTGPDVGLMLMILGGGVTLKGTPLLATLPTVTMTFPVVAPVGTVTSMLLSVQLEAVAAVPLKVAVLGP